MGPVRRDEGAGTGSHAYGAGFAIAGFKQQEPLARLGIVNFTAVTPFMEMSARHVIFQADPARRGSAGPGVQAQRPRGRIDRDGRITEHRATTLDASLRGVAATPDGELWFTENFANKIGRMAPDGTMLGEYDIPTPNSDARCIAAMSDGRFFFTQCSAGLIGEVIVK